MEEFKELILWAEEVPQRVEELKKVLRLNQNYLEARDHAMLAVGKDNRLRFWTNANVSHAGALFSANLGSIELDGPAGTACHSLGSLNDEHNAQYLISPQSFSGPNSHTPKVVHARIDIIAVLLIECC